MDVVHIAVEVLPAVALGDGEGVDGFAEFVGEGVAATVLVALGVGDGVVAPADVGDAAGVADVAPDGAVAVPCGLLGATDTPPEQAIRASNVEAKSAPEKGLVNIERAIFKERAEARRTFVRRPPR